MPVRRPVECVGGAAPVTDMDVAAWCFLLVVVGITAYIAVVCGLVDALAGWVERVFRGDR